MATVYAITRIEHGTGDGEVEVFEVGDKVSVSDSKGINDDVVRGWVEGGSAVEVGKGRKYSEEPPVGAGAPDEQTIKRDELLAKAASALDEDDDDDGAPRTSPAVSTSVGAPAAQTGGSTTIQQAASDKK